MQGDRVWTAEAQIAPEGNGEWHWCCISGESQWVAGFDRGRVTVRLGRVVFRRRGFHQTNSVGYCQIYEAGP